jgi:hypothetical protein
MWATFCDDVRQEVGNKLSYLGIYGANLVVPSFPTTLVKLCCVLSLRVPAATPPRKITFKLLRGEQVIFEAEVEQSEIKDPAVAPPVDGPDSLGLTINTVAQLINFQITERCYLRTLAIVDGKELRGGALELLSMDATH